MPINDFIITIESENSRTHRARQLESVFDVPAAERASLEWRGSLDLDAFDWRIGAIIGPSGSGKTTLLRRLFSEPI